MPEAAPVSNFDRVGGVLSIRHSGDRDHVDIEIRPSAYLFRSKIRFGFFVAFLMGCLLLPLVVGFTIWRKTADASLPPLFVLAPVPLIGIAVSVWFILKKSVETVVRISLSEEGLVVERDGGLNPLPPRHWNRAEIHGVMAQRGHYPLDIACGGNWGVVLKLSMFEAVLASGLSRLDAQALSDLLCQSLDLRRDQGRLAEASPNAHALPVLSYADVPARHHVLVERTPDRITIVIPQKGLSRFLSSQPEAIISLDAHTLNIDCVDRRLSDDNNQMFQRSWPRDQIASIKGDLYGMGLTIRVAGNDVFELLHHYPKELRVWIAETLNEQLVSTLQAGKTS